MRMPTYYLCHGGGPWPWMEGPLRRMLSRLEESLLDVPVQLPARPKAILVVSSHWEEPAFTVTAQAAPGMVYDFHGFPPETYCIRYPSPGSPALAAHVLALLQGAGLPAAASHARGLDHGSYSLLQPMFPQADIPVVQMSLCTPFDAGLHLRAGAALAPLRDEGVLLIGSGMSCHERGHEMVEASPVFDSWLQQAVEAPDPRQCEQALRDWQDAPFARTVHPHEDHLLPLMVAAGAAREARAERIYGEKLMGFVAVSSFRFGN